MKKINIAQQLCNLEVDYSTVNGDTILPFVEEGKIDLECGSTTNNADRRKRVDFSIPYYVSGVKILARKGEGIESITDIKGKKVAQRKFRFLLKEGIVFPPNLNLEQASSQSTAEFKAKNP